MPYIPCVEWFFFEDEEIPFPKKTLPEWQPDDVPSFVRRHKHDYLEVGEKYGTTEAFAINLFVNHRARPSINLIRACALDGINPVEFFTEGDASDDGKFYPDRGDIVQLSGKTILVLTKEKHNRATHSLTGVCLENGLPDITSLSSIKYVRIMPELVKKADSELLDNVLKQVRTLFR